MCRTAKLTHQASGKPKNIILETAADLRRYAVVILTQTVRTKAMPLSNETEMTDEERAILG